MSVVKALLRLLTVSIGLLAGGLTAAEELAPDALVAKITAEVLDAIHQDKALQAGDRERALALAEKKILPHVDFQRMTRLAVGKSWRAASPDQQAALVAEFRAMIVRTYSNALEAYGSQTMVVEPLKMAPGETDVKVRNRYLAPGKRPVPVDYLMWKTPAGWKVYDIIVDGISLVVTYRPQFDQIMQHSGIDGLINTLAEKNRQPRQPAPGRPGAA